MAKPLLNSAFNALSGAIDRWVYRQVNGRTFIARRPEPTENEPSEAQMAVRKRFRKAARYASDKALDPILGPAYLALAQARGRAVRALMMSDYLHAPVVTAVDLADFHGGVGDPIRVHAEDDVGVVSVDVEIRAADDTVLEQGAATVDGDKWVYATTVAYPAGTPVTITATAVDRPGGKGSKSVVWS
jgi:hypothetical protein